MRLRERGRAKQRDRVSVSYSTTEVSTRPREVKGASVLLEQQITRGEELLIDAQVRVAFVAGGRVRPIPKSVRAAMEGPHAA